VPFFRLNSSNFADLFPYAACLCETFWIPMTPSSKGSRTFRKALLVSALLLIFIAIGLAAFHRTPWVVPPSEKEMKNPLAPSAANFAAAKEIYSDKCANCHGDGGKGDGSDAMMYDPAPSDLTDAKVAKKTDGELYYQITEGRKPMPSFKKKLTDEQRWQLVLFVRSLAKAPATSVQK
jgi:mono/diheme cytochrome c family protein